MVVAAAADGELLVAHLDGTLRRSGDGGPVDLFASDDLGDSRERRLPLTVEARS